MQILLTLLIVLLTYGVHSTMRGLVHIHPARFTVTLLQAAKVPIHSSELKMASIMTKWGTLHRSRLQ